MLLACNSRDLENDLQNDRKLKSHLDNLARTYPKSKIKGPEITAQEQSAPGCSPQYHHQKSQHYQIFTSEIINNVKIYTSMLNIIFWILNGWFVFLLLFFMTCQKTR